MDQTQTKALAALQPFVHLATTTRSPSPRFVTDIITRATSAPGTYVFTELLQTAAIQSLRAADTPPESQSYLTLLEIFSWGTYEEYLSTPNLPALNEAQTVKLRQLSLLTLASPFLPATTAANPHTLTYESLLHCLALDSPSALESLITQSIYTSLLTARLSPTSTPPIVHITSVAPLRDLRPQSLPALLQILQTWESRCTSVISELDNQINTIRNTATARSTLQRDRQDVVDAAVLSEKSTLIEKDENTSKTRSARIPSQGQRGNKRDLEEEIINDDDEDEVGNGRMDIDEGLGADVAGHGAMGPSSSVRGNKRNRGRG